MTALGMLLSLAVMLFSDLMGAVGGSAERAVIPDFMQMHTGSIDEAQIKAFVRSLSEIIDYQICSFLNLNNSEITLMT